MKIDKLIDIYDKSDNSKGDDYNLVCVAHNEPYKKTLRIIEKSPLNMFNFHSGIVLYWYGALEASDNAIQQIKIESIDK